MIKLLKTILIILLTVSCNSNKQKVTFVLDWTPNTNHTGIFVAKELGYFDDLDIDFEIIQPSQNTAIQIVASNTAQFGIDFQPSLAIPLEKKLPITVVMAIMQHNTAGLMSYYSSIDELSDKRFSTWSNKIDEACVVDIVGDSISFVPSDSFDALAGLKLDQYDFIMVYKGWDYIKAKKIDSNINFFPLIEYNWVFDYYTPVIIANNDFLENNNKLAKDILSAISKGYEYAINNPEKSIDLVSKYMDVDIEFLKESQKYVSTQYKNDSEKFGVIDLERMESIL